MEGVYMSLKTSISSLNKPVLSLFGLTLLVSGCATTPSRTKEYEEIKTSVTEYHEVFLFGPDKPYLTERMTQKLPDNRAMLAYFTQTYFAADTHNIAAKCQINPLICSDPQTLEVLFRNLHNASVVTSRQEKLKLVDEWYRGKLTDSELQSALHIEFKYDKGELLIRLHS